MELLTLPDELLASVVKYYSFHSLSKLRKISTKLNRISKKYRLNNPDIHTLEIIGLYGRILFKITPVFDKCNIITMNHNKEYFPFLFKFYLSQVRRINSLLFCDENKTDHLIITEDMAKTILEKRDKKFSEISVIKCILNFDMQLLRRILVTFPITSLTLRVYAQSLEVSPFQEKLYEGLQFNYFELANLSSTFASDISAQFLQEICSRRLPNQFAINQMNVNLKELGQFLEQFITDSFDGFWWFSVRARNMTKDQIQQFFAQLKGFENLNIEVCTQNEFAVHVSVSEYIDDTDIPILEIAVDI